MGDPLGDDTSDTDSTSILDSAAQVKVSCDPDAMKEWVESTELTLTAADEE